jgi:erythromycin esterase-like protein
MTSVAGRTASRAIRDAAHRLVGEPRDFDGIIDHVGEARFVLIGEASHGTHEFYRIRAEITKRLIRDKGFSAVAVEADWPDAYRVNRFVRGGTDDANATEALSGFQRFPQWMWRNADVLDFVGWLRAHNDTLPPDAHRTGFYGLDLYSMHASMAAVLEYLRLADPIGAAKARERYSCFDHFGEDPQAYGYATSRGLATSCEDEAVAQLVDLRRAAAEHARHDGGSAGEDLFFAAQNARLVRNAERYYRAMFTGRASSWNLRDRHMAETLHELTEFLAHRTERPRVVVWAHNSHLGDARATEMGHSGEINVGQLARQRYGRDAVLIGFSTWAGTVTAASNWDEPAQRKIVRPALPDSYEALLHETGVRNFVLYLHEENEAVEALAEARLERAIGVIYRPETERVSHYFTASLPLQFDAILHYDVTRAVEPLERTARWDRTELPETYPSAL